MANCPHPPDHPKWRTCRACRNRAIGAGVRRALGRRIRPRLFEVVSPVYGSYESRMTDGGFSDYRRVFASTARAAIRLAVKSWRRALHDPQFGRRIGTTGRWLHEFPDSPPFAGVTAHEVIDHPDED